MRSAVLRRLGLAAAGIAVLLLHYAIVLAGPGSQVCVGPDCATVAAAGTDPCCGGCGDDAAPLLAPAADCGCRWLPLPDDRLPQLAVWAQPSCTPARAGSVAVLAPPPARVLPPVLRPAPSPHLQTLRGVLLTC